MNTRLPISLTPNFSWVFSTDWMLKPFQRFSVSSRKTVKTVFSVRTLALTWLKPGVNESGARAIAAFSNSHTFL